jgi:hypothetical protein
MLANITLLLQLVEGGAYRGSADMKAFGEISFNNPGSRREFSVHDELSKFLKCRPNAGPVNQLGRPDLREIFSSD